MALRELFGAIGQASGVDFVLDIDTGRSVSVDMDPAPLRQAVSDLADRLGYGYAWLDGRREGAIPARVFLLRQGQGAPLFEMAMPRAVSPQGHAVTNSVQHTEVLPTVTDPAAIQQNRFIEQLMEACKQQQECDAS